VKPAARLTNMAKKLRLTRLGNMPCRSGRFGGVSGSCLSRTASANLSRGSGLLRMRFATMGAPWLNPCPAPSSLRPPELAELILLNGLSPHLALYKAACKSPPVRPLEHG